MGLRRTGFVVPGRHRRLLTDRGGRHVIARPTTALPGPRPAAARDSLRAAAGAHPAGIAAEGVWIQAVHGDGPSTTYGYTVGLNRLDHPELLVTGMGCPSVCNVLDMVTHPVLEHGMRLRAGMVLDLGAPLAGLIEVVRPGWWLTIARELSAQPVRALQLALSDEELRLPGTPGYDLPLASQPLLGNPIWTVPGWSAPDPVSVFEPPTSGGESATL